MSRERTDSSTWQQPLLIVFNVLSLVGAVAAIAQIIDYSTTLTATLWISIGIALAVVPALLAAVFLVVRRNWRTLGLVSLLLALIVGGVGIIAWQIGGLVKPSCPDGDRDSSSSRFAYPEGLENADDVDLEYCRVDINEGQPLSRQYTLRGKLVGTVPDNRVVALIVRPDPGSCDALGYPGNGNYYLRQVIRFDGKVSSWDRSDAYSYPAAIALRYHFYYVLTTEAVLTEMRVHERANIADNGGYHGIPQLPYPARKIATFSMQGKSENQRPCR